MFNGKRKISSFDHIVQFILNSKDNFMDETLTDQAKDD